jgi:threonine dehydrogenase-like Zn-dependent dehydrogenase
MRAAVTRSDHLDVQEVDDPVAGPGHVLARTLACGICGSDLHALQNLAQLASLSARVGAPGALDPGRDLIFGHEFCAEILEYGPETERRLEPGTRVCAMPVLLAPSGVEAIGYSHSYPGGLAELIVLQEALLLEVPDGLAPEHAALTEPLAVGEHAVGIADVQSGDVCLVLGCGPVGLAVIAALKLRGHGPVIAADFSPTRRRLAELLGADVTVDPREHSPHERWADFGVVRSISDTAAIEFLGGTTPAAVIFEAVGTPGMLQAIIDEAPPKARVVVVGVCMTPDQIEPALAVMKQLEVRFSFGYNPAEFETSLDRLGGGLLPADQLVTGVVDLDDVAAAFRALANPGDHGKLIVRH